MGVGKQAQRREATGEIAQAVPPPCLSSKHVATNSIAATIVQLLFLLPRPCARHREAGARSDAPSSLDSETHAGLLLYKPHGHMPGT